MKLLMLSFMVPDHLVTSEVRSNFEPQYILVTRANILWTI